jgi:hypothetical protein
MASSGHLRAGRRRHGSLPQGFAAFIPSYRAINLITKADWQGVGVKPDVEVPAEKALDTAHKLALDRLAATSNAKK